MKFTVNEPSPSQNVTDRMHWGARKKLKEDWYWLMVEAVGSKGKIKRIVSMNDGYFNHIKITRFGARKLDEGNLIGGMKPIIDNLLPPIEVEHDYSKYGYMVTDTMRYGLGLIEDDSPDKCTFEYHQETGKPYRTEFELSVRG